MDRIPGSSSGGADVAADIFYGAQHSHRVTIRDARRGCVRPSLEVEGFELLNHRSVVSDFTDLACVEREHFAELARLLARITGADRVLVLRREVTIRMSRHPGERILDV
jgi:hypothetical protein